MSNRALTWAFELPLIGAPKHVLVALADHADDAGQCYPSVPRLILWSGNCRTVVLDALKQLELSGLVTIARSNGHRSSYTLSVGTALPDQCATRTGPQYKPVRHTDRYQSARRTAPVRQADRTSPPGGPEPLRTITKPPANPKEARIDHAGQERVDLSAPPEPLPAVTPPAPARQQGRAKRRAPLDPSWQPDVGGIAFAQQHGIENVAAELQRFRDWHLSASKLTADPAASWRTWCTRAAEFHRRGNGAAHPVPLVANGGMPARGDPPQAWAPFAETWSIDDTGHRQPSVNGWQINVAADLVCEAARINDANWRGDWRPLIAWLRDGADLHDHVLPAIKRIAARPNYRPPASLRYFDSAVRQAAGLPARSSPR
jgi:hypothetical protein